METTTFPNCVLLHDGDFDRAMYLRTAEENPEERRAVVVTRAILEDALRDQPDNTKIVLKGPCGFTVDRHAVTLAPSQMAYAKGDYPTQTIQVARTDIERIVIASRVGRMNSLLAQLNVPQQPLPVTLGVLDRIAAQLDGLVEICPAQ